jgi:hypothetical protein
MRMSTCFHKRYNNAGCCPDNGSHHCNHPRVKAGIVVVATTMVALHVVHTVSLMRSTEASLFCESGENFLTMG